MTQSHTHSSPTHPSLTQPAHAQQSAELGPAHDVPVAASGAAAVQGGRRRGVTAGIMLAGAAILAAGLSLDSKGQAAPRLVQEPSGAARFMRAKLEASKTVMEGLVTENFDQVSAGAQKLLVMSKAAEWQVVPGPIYSQHSAEFQRSAERLLKQSEEKNLDGATLSYLQLTMSCVTCHKYVRGAKLARHGHPAEFDNNLKLADWRATNFDQFRMRLAATGTH